MEDDMSIDHGSLSPNTLAHVARWLATTPTGASLDLPLDETSVINEPLNTQLGQLGGLSTSFNVDQREALPLPDLTQSLTASQDSYAFLSTEVPQPQQDIPATGRHRSRSAVREKRSDNEPKVYRELPSFPPFDQPIPDGTTIEEICHSYPNHLRGSNLDAFIQWHWSATNIYTHLSDAAVREFVEQDISTCKDPKNRANFLFKRLDARIKSMSIDEIAALCSAPKIRGCLMNGGEFYGGSKLGGKYHNPKAQPVRKFPQRRRKAARGLESPPSSPIEVVETGENILENATALPRDPKSEMAEQWREQHRHASAILDADEFYRRAQGPERHEFILRLMQWPVSNTTMTIFNFEAAEASPAFGDMIDSTIRDVASELIAPSLGDALANGIHEQINIATPYAVDVVLTERRALTLKLKNFAIHARGLTTTTRKYFGVVHWTLAQIDQSVTSVGGQPLQAGRWSRSRGTPQAEKVRKIPGPERRPPFKPARKRRGIPVPDGRWATGLEKLDQAVRSADLAQEMPAVPSNLTHQQFGGAVPPNRTSGETPRPFEPFAQQSLRRENPQSPGRLGTPFFHPSAQRQRRRLMGNLTGTMPTQHSTTDPELPVNGGDTMPVIWNDFDREFVINEAAGLADPNWLHDVFPFHR